MALLARIDPCQRLAQDPPGGFSVGVAAQHQALGERQLVAVAARQHVQVNVGHRLECGVARAARAIR